MALHALDLCAGYGGMSLGLRIAMPETRTVCYVEREAFCAAVLVQAMEQGRLDPAPVWSDLATFDGKPWRGVVDLVTAGFPCQPFSTASRGRAVAANLWPEVFRVICEVRPRLVFLENVQREPIEDAADDLGACGLRVRYCKVDSAALGSPHSRPRWWLLADADNARESALRLDAEVAGISAAGDADWWSTFDPALLGDDVRPTARVDRLRAIGNGVVPLAAAVAFDILLREVAQ